MHDILEPPVAVPRNRLLLAPEPSVSLDELLAVARAAPSHPGDSPGSDVLANLGALDEGLVTRLHSHYGEGVLFRLQLMALTHARQDFDFFLDHIASAEAFFRSASRHDSVKFERDNHLLPQGPDLDLVASTVLQPSLSRKVYNPGQHDGYVAYGIGGPRILVSHPFQGISDDYYDFVHNSLDVTTSLILRGYHGTFLFLDYIPALNAPVKGIPMWALWFSIIAFHSDLVVFVKEYDREFGDAQRREVELTPDRVNKKLVAIPHGELEWATVPAEDVIEYSHVTKTVASRRLRVDRGHAEQTVALVTSYTHDDHPTDRLVKVDESGEITVYPPDYPLYDVM